MITPGAGRSVREDRHDRAVAEATARREAALARAHAPGRWCWAHGPPDHPGTWRGLLTSWERSGDGSWQGLVTYIVDSPRGPEPVTGWLPADRLAPATAEAEPNPTSRTH